jgi:hypothetical protein
MNFLPQCNSTTNLHRANEPPPPPPENLLDKASVLGFFGISIFLEGEMIEN